MHLLDVAELTDDALLGLLDRAEQMAAGRTPRFDDAIICMAFFEPSTRTRLSFEAAAHRLGARVIGFSDAMSTSGAKGETLEDTIRVLSGYVDAIVMRHPETGSVARASAHSAVPIVNGGDGAGHHPTQTLLDLYTMRQHVPLADATVTVLGDLRYGRTVHSLVPALQRLGATVQACPSPGLELPTSYGVPTVSLDEAIDASNVLYATRVQRERLPDAAQHAAAEAHVGLDAQRLQGFEGIVMHPLPRRAELDVSVDELPAAKYFEQAKNGVPVRMAVLASLLESVS